MVTWRYLDAAGGKVGVSPSFPDRAGAEAWIGARAPATFRREAARLDTLTIEPGRLYRSCVTSADGNRSYCVIVKMWLPMARSVTFAGHERNAVFATGVG